MKILVVIFCLLSIGDVSGQDFDLSPEQTILRDDIVKADIEALKEGMTMREVISLLGYPEAAAVQLPFMSYKASDRNDGYRYILYLSPKEAEEEIFDQRIIAAEAAKSPWTFDQPSEVIWTSEEWNKIRNQNDANRVAGGVNSPSSHTTTHTAP